MKMDIGSSQSWWWESHNRPKHSKWLQENLADVEANVQSMLTLIEGDADSFAQRAEMYYKKRPDLLKVVEQFYRGYRALAERYDQLSGSIRQVPTAVQNQYGLVSESPRASPFGKQVSFLKPNSNTIKESSNELANESGELSGPEGEGESLDTSSVEDKSTEQGRDSDDSSSSSSDVEFDGASLEIQRLHKTVENLQSDNKRLVDKSREKLQQFRETEKRLHGFREDFLRAQKESNTFRSELQAGEKLKKKLEEEIRDIRLQNETFRQEVVKLEQELDKQRGTTTGLQDDANMLRGENTKLVIKEKELVAGLRFMKGAALSLLKRNRSLLEDISALTKVRMENEELLAAKEVEVTSLVLEVEKLGCSLEESQETVASLNIKVAELNQEVMGLQMSLSECGEGKREVIRQLCYTIDLMNERNQWLEEVLVSAKSKINQYQKIVAAKKSGWF